LREIEEEVSLLKLGGIVESRVLVR
jgi:hypothetical protein